MSKRVQSSEGEWDVGCLTRYMESPGIVSTADEAWSWKRGCVASRRRQTVVLHYKYLPVSQVGFQNENWNDSVASGDKRYDVVVRSPTRWTIT